jgi:hypothetical protein
MPSLAAAACALRAGTEQSGTDIPHETHHTVLPLAGGGPVFGGAVSPPLLVKSASVGIADEAGAAEAVVDVDVAAAGAAAAAEAVSLLDLLLDPHPTAATNTLTIIPRQPRLRSRDFKLPIAIPFSPMLHC